MRLVPAVQDGSPFVAPHSGASHFMIAVAGYAWIFAANNFSGANGIEYFGGALRHVSMYGQLVRTPADVDVESWNSPCIAQRFIEARAILIAGQCFAKAGKRHHSGAERGESRLESSANSCLSLASLPSDATRTALELIAATEI